MVDTNKLRGKIVERMTTQESLAIELGIDKSTLYRKMKTNGTFSVKEANQIVKFLKLSEEEAIAIFFADTFAEMRQSPA